MSSIISCGVFIPTTVSPEIGKKRHNVTNNTTYPVGVLNTQHLLLLAYTNPCPPQKIVSPPDAPFPVLAYVVYF